MGRRRLLVIGAVAFGLASVVAAYSTNAETLIAARAALGVAGATLMPSTLALISNMFADARQRALAIGVWATMFALGMAAGPLVGGLLLERFWWGSAFLVAVPIAVLVPLAAPPLLPEYRAPGNGRIDLLSVALSLAATLPMFYAVKHVAAQGVDLTTLLTLLAGVVFAVVFVRRQRRLESPLLDMELFAIAAPLLARRIRPGYVVAGALALSTVGYLLLALVPGVSSLAPVVIGFGLVYLGLGAIAALGTDLVVGAAPPDKAGSAAAMSETVQELGLAVGVATLGSLTTAVYRNHIATGLPAGLPHDLDQAVRESLSRASSVPALPVDLLGRARDAFTAGLNASAVVAGVAVLVLAALSAAALRHIGTTGGDEHGDSRVG